MAAGQIGADEAQTITPANFAFGVVLCTAIATVIASMLARRAGRPVRTFVVTTVVLTAVSLVTPFAAGATATSTKLALAAAHLLAAAVVIPILTGAIRRTQPTRS